MSDQHKNEIVALVQGDILAEARSEAESLNSRRSKDDKEK